MAGQATQQGNEGLLEDALAAVRPWGIRLDAIRVPVLIMRGAEDKMVPCAHGEWLAARVRVTPCGCRAGHAAQRGCLTTGLALPGGYGGTGTSDERLPSGE